MKGVIVYEFSCIDIKTLDYGGFQFYQTGLICKLFADTGMKNCNKSPKPNKIEATMGTERNGPFGNRYLTNSYESFTGMMLYKVSNIRPFILFAVK